MLYITHPSLPLLSQVSKGEAVGASAEGPSRDTFGLKMGGMGAGGPAGVAFQLGCPPVARGVHTGAGFSPTSYRGHFYSHKRLSVFYDLGVKTASPPVLAGQGRESNYMRIDPRRA